MGGAGRCRGFIEHDERDMGIAGVLHRPIDRGCRLQIDNDGVPALHDLARLLVGGVVGMDDLTCLNDAGLDGFTSRLASSLEHCLTPAIAGVKIVEGDAFVGRTFLGINRTYHRQRHRGGDAPAPRDRGVLRHDRRNCLRVDLHAAFLCGVPHPGSQTLN